MKSPCRVIVGLVCVAFGNAFAETPYLNIDVIKSSEKTAREWLDSFLTSVKSNADRTADVAALGFDSQVQASTSVLGSAFPIVTLNRADLEALRRSRPPEVLAKQIDVVLYPVLTGDGSPHTSVTLEKIQGTWRVSSYGSPLLARGVIEAKKFLDGRRPSSQYFIAHIPLFHFYLVGQISALGTQFVPISPHPRFGLEVGRIISVRSWNRLADAASRHKEPRSPVPK